MKQQRGHNLDIPEYFKLIYWLGICSVMVVWSLYVPYIVVNRTSAVTVIPLFGITVIILCLLLWVGDATQYRSLRRSISLGIWSSFIVSVLLTGAVVVRSSFLPQHIKVEKFTLLNEAYVKLDENKNPYLNEFQVRPNNYYELKNVKDFKMAFAIVASDFQHKADGNFEVGGDIVLYNSSKMVADIGQLPKTSKIEEWKSRTIPIKLMPEKIKAIPSVLGNIEGKMIFIQIIHQISEAVLTENNLELKVRLYDFANQSFDEQNVQFVLHKLAK